MLRVVLMLVTLSSPAYSQVETLYPGELQCSSGEACGDLSITRMGQCTTISNLSETRHISVDFIYYFNDGSNWRVRPDERFAPLQEKTLNDRDDNCINISSIGIRNVSYFDIVLGAEIYDNFFGCTTLPANHQTWIGGHQRDLVVLAQNGLPIYQGEFFRIQDGDDYACGVDVFTSRNFTVVRYGVNRDIVDIFVSSGDNSFERNTFRIHDGRWHPLFVTENAIGRLVGRNHDIVYLYAVTPDGSIYAYDRRIQDGKSHTLVGLGNDIGIIYGRNNDVRGRFCFESGEWREVLGSRNGQFPESCHPLPESSETMIDADRPHCTNHGCIYR